MKRVSRSKRLLVATLGAATVTMAGCGAVGNLMAPPPSDLGDNGDTGKDDSGATQDDSNVGPGDK